MPLWSWAPKVAGLPTSRSRTRSRSQVCCQGRLPVCMAALVRCLSLWGGRVGCWGCVLLVSLDVSCLVPGPSVSPCLPSTSGRTAVPGPRKPRTTLSSIRLLSRGLERP